MKRLVWRYILMTLFAVVTEAMLGRLGLGQWFTPLLYIAPLILLPTTVKPITALLMGAALGLIGDIVMGTVALNIIAAMATAMLRRPFLKFTMDDVVIRKRTPITTRQVGARSFWAFALLLVAIHCIIFFAFETLSFHHILYTLGRTAIAWLAAALFTWIISKILNSKF